MPSSANSLKAAIHASCSIGHIGLEAALTHNREELLPLQCIDLQNSRDQHQPHLAPGSLATTNA
jgi:hypothetical protein